MRIYLSAALLLLSLLAGCADASSCGEGLELRGDRCIPVCVDVCGEHQECVVGEIQAQCECVSGYAGDPCTWTGGLRDPQFTDPSAWADAPNSAAVLPLESGLSGPGIASFTSEIVCTSGAVAQVVEMPSYADAEPFVIEVDYQSEDVIGVDVGYNRAFRRLGNQVPGGGWWPYRFCVGEAGYGGDVKFQVAAFERLPDCLIAPIGTIKVDRFEILVANEGECPTPGSVLNGQANVGEGGWEFDAPGSSEGGLREGKGEAGTSAAWVHKPAGSEDRAAMYTSVSVPLPDEDNPSPALRFWWSGKPNWSYWVNIGTYPGREVTIRPLDVLIGDGTPQVHTYCLPPWTHGNVVDLSFTTGGGRFPDEAELAVDNVEIISDPKCGVSQDLLDPSFDAAPNRRPGVWKRLEDEQVSTVNIIDDPTRARPPGSGALELVYGSNHAWLDANTYVWVPPSEGERGPQLVYHSNTPASPGLGVFWALGSATLPNAPCEGEFCPTTPLTSQLPRGGDWRRNTVCLPPEWAERWYLFWVAIRPSVEPLEVYDPPRAVLLDDFEVRTSEECPAR
ncbi:MAG: hypothetical protein WBM48_02755 [Polyangiales bacterium]|jgi:hypothetical protein